MTALDRARGWFIAPPPTPPSSRRTRTPSPRAPRRVRVARSRRRGLAGEPRAGRRPLAALGGHAAAAAVRCHRRRSPRSRAGTGAAAAECVRVRRRPRSTPGRRHAPRPVGPLARPSPADARGASAAPRPGRSRGARSRRGRGVDRGAAGRLGPRVTSAAVLGRAGEVEPVAAALALALRRETRAKAAAVAVVGPLPPEAGEWESAPRRPGGSARGSRRTGSSRVCADGSRGCASIPMTRSSRRRRAARDAGGGSGRAGGQRAAERGDRRGAGGAGPAGPRRRPIPRVRWRGSRRRGSTACRSSPRGRSAAGLRGRWRARACGPPRSSRALLATEPEARSSTRACTYCRLSLQERARSVRGQASILLIGGLAGILIATVIVGAVARAVGKEAAAQRAADLAAVAAARVMHDNYGRLFEPAYIRRRPNPSHLEKAEYLALGRTAALRVAAANDAPRATVSFPDEDTIAPVRVRVAVRETRQGGEGQGATVAHGRGRRRRPSSAPAADLTFATGGGYSGPLETRQGERMRPDVALAFDRMEAAARADGVALTINSGFRSDAEQAVLWHRHPDPKWVARPGTSLHRNATELDLGPPSAYGWLAANAPRFHFIQRYAWEPWHFGFTLNPASRRRPAAATAATARRARRTGRCPGSCRRASRRCCATRPSAGTSPRSCSPPSSTPNRASTRSRSRRRGAGDRAVHAGDGARHGPRRPVRRRAGDRRPGAPDARPAAAVRLGAARARGLQRRPGRPCRAAAACRTTPRRAATSRGSWD